MKLERSANVLYVEFLKIAQCKNADVLELLGGGTFSSFRFLYVLDSKCAVALMTFTNHHL